MKKVLLTGAALACAITFSSCDNSKKEGDSKKSEPAKEESKDKAETKDKAESKDPTTPEKTPGTEEKTPMPEEKTTPTSPTTDTPAGAGTTATPDAPASTDATATPDAPAAADTPAVAAVRTALTDLETYVTDMDKAAKDDPSAMFTGVGPIFEKAAALPTEGLPDDLKGAVEKIKENTAKLQAVFKPLMEMIPTDPAELAAWKEKMKTDQATGEAVMAKMMELGPQMDAASKAMDADKGPVKEILAKYGIKLDKFLK